MGVINATRLQKCFIEWMKDCCDLTKGEVIAIDGKTVRGSYDNSRGLGAIHMVNAFATENGVSFGQHKAYEKSNEITAITELLELLDISGCLVSIAGMPKENRSKSTKQKRGLPTSGERKSRSFGVSVR